VAATTPDDLQKTESFPGGIWEPSSPVLTPNNRILISPFTSPPTSPRSPSSNFNPYFGNASGDKVSGRRFSFGSDLEKDSCDNCNFVIPKDVSEMLPEGAPGSPSKEGKGQQGSPVLRTVQRISACGSVSSLEDDDDDDDDDDDELTPHHTLNAPTSQLSTSPTPSQESTNSGNMPLYHSSGTHYHSLTYVTRRNPDSQSLYSRLRHSCIRALSCESLPRGSPSGPILFGDPIAGYTIAYLFRLPDPRARGRRRTYALQALSSDWRRASNAFTQVTRAFETIANNIVSLADRVLERETAGLGSRPSTADLLRSSGGAATAGTTPPQQGQAQVQALSSSLPNDASVGTVPGSPVLEQGQNLKAKSSANSPVGSQRNLTDVSSFLAAKVDSYGYPRVSREVMRAKGLPEIVGTERFFVELHAQFCVILYNLVAGLR
jgi:Vesicle coat protein involved in Golgi to plasma membrane transport